MLGPHIISTFAERFSVQVRLARAVERGGDLLDIYVGADEDVIKEEDFPLLRLQDLSPLAIHGLNKRLTKDE